MSRRAAGVLFVLGWVFWLHRWVPMLLFATFLLWAILHDRLEGGGLGNVLGRWWRRAWPPGPVVLVALTVASALAFVLSGAPVKAKILPVALEVLALALTLPTRFAGASTRPLR